MTEIIDLPNNPSSFDTDDFFDRIMYRNYLLDAILDKLIAS